MSILKSLFLFAVYILIKVGGLIHSHSLVSQRKKIKRVKKHTVKPIIPPNNSRILFSSLDSKKNKKAIKNFKKGSYLVGKRVSRGILFFLKMPYHFLLLLLFMAQRCIAITISFLKFLVRPFTKISSLRPFKKKRGRKRVKQKRAILYAFKLVTIGVTFSFVFIFLPLLALLFYFELPDPHNLSSKYVPKTTKIYDRNDKLLYEIYANQNRSIITLDKVPKYLKEATLSIEDKDFYHHPGFDIKGITRAFISNLKHKELQGGSTITQQLIRSAFLSLEPTIIRKVKEVILAFWAERLYSKDEILELYFNYVPYGGTAWGIEAAAETYFGKSVSELTLAESAFLAGLTRGPSIYSPFNGEDMWKRRQKEVIDAMVRERYITRVEAEKAFKEELHFRTPEISIKAPHFVMYVKNLLVEKYGLSEVERGGLQVKTSLDLSLQESTQQTVTNEVTANSYLNISNGAALITNPQNGDILAMVGSINYFDLEHNGNVNLTTSLRQPGSTIKLITYTLALSSGFTEGTILDDTPFAVYNAGEPPYIPVNYDGRFRGRLPLRLAFANSLNIPAVRVAQKFGVSEIVKMGQNMGIKSWTDPDRYGLSITLGGAEVTMLELSTAYGTIANSGKKVELDPFLEIRDSYGKILYKKEVHEEQVINEGVAYIIADILADNAARTLAFGPNSPLTIPGHKVSVKTGTTDNKRDNWTVGFTKDLLIATWVGNFDNSPMSPSLTSGISGAAPIWNKLITTNLKDKKTEFLALPDNVIRKICNGRDTYFIRGTENSVSCGSYFAPITVPPRMQ